MSNYLVLCNRKYFSWPNYIHCCYPSFLFLSGKDPRHKEVFGYSCYFTSKEGGSHWWGSFFVFHSFGYLYHVTDLWLSNWVNELHYNIISFFSFSFLSPLNISLFSFPQWIVVSKKKKVKHYLILKFIFEAAILNNFLWVLAFQKWDACVNFFPFNLIFKRNKYDCWKPIHIGKKSILTPELLGLYQLQHWTFVSVCTLHQICLEKHCVGLIIILIKPLNCHK